MISWFVCSVAMVTTIGGGVYLSLFCSSASLFGLVRLLLEDVPARSRQRGDIL